jgi:hypothetical protein
MNRIDGGKEISITKRVRIKNMLRTCFKEFRLKGENGWKSLSDEIKY